MEVTTHFSSIAGNSVHTSDYHARSLQDTLDAGKAVKTSTKALDDICSRVYRPTIGFYRNTYITDDFGHSIKVSAKDFAKVHHSISLEITTKEDAQCLQ